MGSSTGGSLPGSLKRFEGRFLWGNRPFSFARSEPVAYNGESFRASPLGYCIAFYTILVRAACPDSRTVQIPGFWTDMSDSRILDAVSKCQRAASYP